MSNEKRGLQRFCEYRDRIQSFIDGISSSPEPNPVLLKFFGIILENDKKTIDCIENNKPLLSGWYGNAPEIFAAMDVHYFCAVDNILAHQPFTSDLEGMDASAVPSDMCGLIKLGVYGVEAGLVPVPTAMITMLEPCDAQSAIHEAWENTDAWKGVPTFILDPAYGNDKEDYVYFAGELKRMIAFLEDHLGRKMDYNKLREVVERTNEQYAAWAEYNELRRAIPCPHDSFVGSKLGWGATQHVTAGLPETTEMFKMLAYDAEQKVKQGIGALPKEKVRVLWADLVPTWADPLAAWLAEECGANIVMDFQGYTPYEHIDTSSVESMLLGLAKRNMAEVPMIRQARGTVDVMIEDITRIVRDYKCDCVFFPGHVGHKDQSASIAFIKEACRDLKIPLLILTVDNFDPRYTPFDVLKRQITEFFNAHGLL
ncbi:2-hydroxyacyl-CoA dehydratase [Geobacter sp. FeAm09]|uniref:2-hydroxyacyl-CoA dehydratase subunit D n=1 Tax=Geobacter sp. FeAm09 TaxID=2597769 RepID=UPI0011EC5DE7|nr:2-hydroxyacyl-CoA dehydratase family protein [Geobacter sp. FeAm09]QEM67699.1 2-hydroxyacyl-CoA dehydratase [Geobacter sp. FeAm09]